MTTDDSETTVPEPHPAAPAEKAFPLFPALCAGLPLCLSAFVLVILSGIERHYDSIANHLVLSGSRIREMAGRSSSQLDALRELMNYQVLIARHLEDEKSGLDFLRWSMWAVFAAALAAALAIGFTHFRRQKKMRQARSAASGDGESI